nr:PREDICTED: uncharacterized protein LOC109033961 isoform X2 [Bemisia tabaci]
MQIKKALFSCLATSFSAIILCFLAGSWGISLKDVDGYLSALDGFQTHSNASFEASCLNLTTAIKTLLRTVDGRRVIQLDAPLFTLPYLNQDRFPVVVYFPCFRACHHIVIQRVDGLLFVFDHYSPEEIATMMDGVGYRNETSSFYRKYLRRPVTHSVFFSLRYSRKENTGITGIVATYLLDSSTRVAVTL